MNLHKYLILLSLSVLVIASESFGYFPPSHYLVKNLTQKHAFPPLTLFKNKVTFYSGNSISGVFNESFLLLDSKNFISKITDEQNTTSKSDFKKNKSSTDLSFLHNFLFESDATTLSELLKFSSFPYKTEAELYSEKEDSLPYKSEDYINLVKCESKFCLRWSAASNTFIDFDRDTLMPYLLSIPVDGRKLKFIFSGTMNYKGLPYPRTIQVFDDSSLWIKIDCLDIKPADSTLVGEMKRLISEGSSQSNISDYFRWIR
jgi:hypothetical protein